MLEELGTIPSEKYATGVEIREHLCALARKYDLYDKAMFQTRVIGADWNESHNRWAIETDRGDRLRPRFLITLIGLFPIPRLPNIPGIETFAGKIFHTARWDYDYTGGDSTGNMTGLADKKVAVVGTGSTGIQVVPPLAEDARELYVIQRTPATVTFRGNRPTDPDWACSLKPKWQKERMQNFVESIACISDADLVNDGWTYLASKAGPIVPTAPPEGTVVTDKMLEEAERADMETMQEIRDRIAAVVEDEVTAKALMPYYRLACKRPGFSDDYLQTFNRDNVRLIDTNGQGVTRIRENTIVCGDVEIEVNCIILATGFDVNSTFDQATGFDVRGVDGLSLSEKWKHGYKSLYGLQVAGLPNYFPVGYHGNGVAPNYTSGVIGLCEQVTYVIEHCLSNHIIRVDVEQAAEDAWVQRMKDKDVGSEFLAECIPGYYNNEGDMPEKGAPTLFSGAYGGGPFEYFDMLEAWRDEGRLRGLITTKGDPDRDE